MAWNPWRTLRTRRHITLHRTPLHGPLRGIYAPRGDRAVILLDTNLSRRERAATLAHELVHDERGGGADAEWMPATWAAVVARDEATVERIAALRLLPADELVEWLASRIDLGGVTAWEIADAFDVTETVAKTCADTLDQSAA